MKFKSYFLAILCCLPFLACQKGISVVNPTVEMLSNPIGLTDEAPRLGWQIESQLNDVRQTSYHIFVSSSEAQLLSENPVADMWDSEVVESDQSMYVPYSGKSLKSGTCYYWRVLVNTNKGKAWSEVQHFQMGILDSSLWLAKWIGGEFPDDVYTIEALHFPKVYSDPPTSAKARYLRKDFEVAGTISNATLYISGLGLYEAFLNGERIGNQELAPGPTDYEKRVFYNTFDVTDMLQNGANAIGVTLGNGRFFPMRIGSQIFYGTPRLLAQLDITLADGTIMHVCSDSSWRIMADGPIGFNNEFDGEQYDARKEMSGWNEAGYADTAWRVAELVEAPKGMLVSQINPNIEPMDEVKPIALFEREPNVFVLDMGQNMVGWLRMNIHADAGDSIVLAFAETLADDSTLYTENLRGAKVTDCYVAKGANMESWEPTFTYHGFRYVEIRGLKYQPKASDFLGIVLYDRMETTGTFECSNPLFDTIVRNSFWGIRGNYRGMPTDCPQRDERMGWLGDRGVGCYGEAFLFNNHHLYAKWIQDIEDAQNEEGVVPAVAPHYWPIYHNDVTWPAAWILSANMVLEQYGDLSVVRKHYPAMKRWMLHLQEGGNMVNYILQTDTYGDWCVPPESLELIHSKDSTRITDGRLLSTSFYYMLSDIMARFACLLGNAEDEQYWHELCLNVQEAFNKEFLDVVKGCYSNNTVTANMLPLRFGMVPAQYKEQVFSHIVDKTVNDCNSHVSAGVIGVQQLMRGLSDNGRPDVAWTIATNPTYPGWGYMARCGATTIWELWNGNTANPEMNSGNHVMLLGDLIPWTFGYLAGIGQPKDSYGFKQVQMRPLLVDGLDYVKASYQSIYGKIESHWLRKAGKFNWHFTIPCNTTAVVCIPVHDGAIDHSTQKTVEKSGGRFREMDGDYALFDFPSGSFDISVKY